MGADGGIYRLAEDPDHRFALYASAGGAGKKVPPHNHTTWAIIAGVHGAERNVVYDRLDNGAREDLVQLREAPAKEKTLRRGDVICYLPEDFHHIETPGGLRQRAAPAFLRAEPGAPAQPRVGRHGDGHAKRFMAKAKILTPLLDVKQVKAMLKSGEIFGFFDVREEGEFSMQGHPLFATPLPLSRLEPRAFALLPDPHTRIVLMDSGDEAQDPPWTGRANRAAARLSRLGYTNIAVMKGGLKAWRDAGYEVFTGVNVPSKAFGEVVEHENDTPRIDAADLQKLVDAKTDLVILDSRPMPEFNNMSIPGGVDCPGAELVYRVKDFAPEPQDAGGGELRRPHALDHRRAIADQCRPAQQGDCAEERHDGLASRRLEGGARRDQELRAAGTGGREVRAGRGGEHRQEDEASRRSTRRGSPSSRQKAARSIASTCAIRGVCAGPSEGLPPCRGRPARSGDRSICRSAQRHHRAARQ